MDCIFAGFNWHANDQANIQKEDMGRVRCTPAYHRSVSGSFKNVLDYLELLAGDDPSYLTGKAVGLVAVAGGLPASVSALTALEFTVHSLRAYVVPYTVPVPFASQLLDGGGQIKNDGIRTRLDLLCQEVVAFLGNWQATVARPSVGHGPGTVGGVA